MADFSTFLMININIIAITAIVIFVSFRIIDTHINKLCKLCRIFSKTVITGRGYSCAKIVYDYQIALATYLKTDVNEDEEVSRWKILLYFYIVMNES